MNFKTFVSMNIAVVGAGKQTETFACSYARAGHEVFIARKSTPGIETHPSLGVKENVNICSIEEAAGLADIIVIASPPRDVREIAYWLGDVRGKVIIDATANINTGADEPINTTGAIKAITGSSYIVKVFSTKGCNQLLKPLLKREGVQWILAGDSKKAKEATKIIAKDVGVDSFLDLGGAEAIPLFDAMTKCWRDLAAKLQAKEIVPNC